MKLKIIKYTPNRCDWLTFMRKGNFDWKYNCIMWDNTKETINCYGFIDQKVEYWDSTIRSLNGKIKNI